MSSFANELSARIRKHPEFWKDIGALYSASISELVPGVQSDSNYNQEQLEEATARLVESAYAFTQTESENDKNIAQAIALFASVSTSHQATLRLSNQVLLALGNFPGIDQIPNHDAESSSFSTYLQESLLRFLNSIKVDGHTYSLTDFQRRVWDSLKSENSTAISAPTSAGKSFLVLEHLCAETISAPSFSAVYIAPTRALLNEIALKLSTKLADHAKGLRISTIPTLDPLQQSKQIFVLTQERLQVLLATSDFDFDLVIVDEAQSIAEQSRGMILQDCLETIKSQGSKTRFLFLAPGANGFANYESATGISNIVVERTDLSPVVQNRVVVMPDKLDGRKITLSLLTEEHRIKVGHYIAERGFENAKTRLAAVALELGRYGGSLVYGTGPADAEKTAGQIASGLAEINNQALQELSKFIKQHVHKRYSLADHVLKGVAYHYGKMPSLLREAIESSFKKGDIHYLACTTTLFQGVNLPARNVFIDTPTRGNKGEALDGAALWNFAGRAGRLGHDICGNVFLVDYDSWEEKPLDHRKAFAIKPSFSTTVVEKLEEVIDKFERAEEPTSRDYSPTDSAVGLMLARTARGTLNTFLERTLSKDLTHEELTRLSISATATYERLGLPSEIIANNWTVDPFGQARLLARFRKKIAKSDYDDLIPTHPSGNVYALYVGIFSRINKYILGNNTARFANKLAATGLSWMKGKPLPQIIADTVKYQESQKGELGNVDSTVRSVFDFIEDTLRFKYVMLGRAYVDLLRFALNEAGHTDDANRVYDFPMALELGISSLAGQAFVELGLSRITAATLENLIPDSRATAQSARKWLAGLKGTEFNFSKVIWEELERKGLLSFSTT